jgi:hypothetical protein
VRLDLEAAGERQDLLGRSDGVELERIAMADQAVDAGILEDLPRSGGIDYVRALADEERDLDGPALRQRLERARLRRRRLVGRASGVGEDGERRGAQ